MPARPVLHIIAGPNGAGKSTLYDVAIRERNPDAEFVNADLLAWQRFGHPAKTAAESSAGQELAEARRRELMAAGRSLVTETTFSHPSKLELMREAREQGYELRLYHVNVRSPELSVLRVANRVEEGGHPVPEDKIRERYVRNQALIREAARMADKAFIYDNSQRDQPHRFVMSMREGSVVRLGTDVPAWARELYADELSRFAPVQVNRPAASFAEAKQAVQEKLGPDARLFIARPDGHYSGSIVHRSGMHLVQQLGPRAAVAHFTTRFERQPELGERVKVIYPKEPQAKVSVQALQASAVRKAPSPAELAEAFLALDAEAGGRKFPELAPFYAVLAKITKAAGLDGMEPARREQVQAGLRTEVARRIELGEQPREPSKMDRPAQISRQQEPGRDR